MHSPFPLLPRGNLSAITVGVSAETRSDRPKMLPGHPANLEEGVIREEGEGGLVRR